MSNSTNLTMNVSNLGYEIFWTFIVPFICLFGTISNFISIISLTKMKVKNHMYKFMVASSATHFFYLIMCGFIFVLRCKSLCHIDSTSYGVIFYHLVIWKYLTSCLGLLISLNEIVMCLQRYSVIRNMEYFKFEKFAFTFTIFTLVSFLVYMPRLFLFKISAFDGQYFLENTRFKTTVFGIFLNVTGSVIRGPILLVIIFVINFLTGLKFTEVIKKKSTLKKLLKINNSYVECYQCKNGDDENQIKAQMNIVKMLIMMCVTFLLGNIPLAIIEIEEQIQQIKGEESPSFIVNFSFFSNTLLFLYHSLDFFIYFIFNKQFRFGFKTIFRN